MVNGHFLKKVTGQYLKKVTGQWSVVTFHDLPHDLSGNKTPKHSYLTIPAYIAVVDANCVNTCINEKCFLKFIIYKRNL